MHEGGDRLHLSPFTQASSHNYHPNNNSSCHQPVNVSSLNSIPRHTPKQSFPCKVVTARWGFLPPKAKMLRQVYIPRQSTHITGLNQFLFAATCFGILTSHYHALHINTDNRKIIFWFRQRDLFFT